MINRIYLIAYKDVTGRGFDENSPWLFKIGDDLSVAQSITETCKKNRYQDITIFYRDDEIPERVSWEYVNEHKIN